MTSDKLSRFWLPAILLLLLNIAAGGIFIFLNRDKGTPVIITQAPDRSFQGRVTIEGAVNNPGTYPLDTGDTVGDIFSAVGGIEESADLSAVFLYIPQVESASETAKININTSGAILLESLPGIGETRAKAIVDYRAQYGDFIKIEDIVNVPGIGPATFEKLKDLIAVTE